MTLLHTFTEPRPDLDGVSILLSGGTGSFGQCFTRTVLDRYHPKKLIIYSRDEMKQYEMAQSLENHPQKKCLRFFIGDVRDYARLEVAMHDVDIVIHAAALKHVPTAEYNPFECIHTNVIGAENIVRASIQNNVKRVVALSTDKAANPINLYGASKLASDKIFVAGNSLSGSKDTRLSVVRYGNVLGSRGSVLPYFKRLIDQGAKYIPITHPEMTRFWLTLEHGVNFVLSSISMMKGGEVFVPKIPSMKIVDLAKVIAPDLQQEIIGIRPGEKIHEVMITEDDARVTLSLKDRYVILPQFSIWSANPYSDLDGVAVPERFKYSSDTNEQWLTPLDLQRLLQDNLWGDRKTQ